MAQGDEDQHDGSGDGSGDHRHRHTQCDADDGSREDAPATLSERARRWLARTSPSSTSGAAVVAAELTGASRTGAVSRVQRRPAADSGRRRPGYGNGSEHRPPRNPTGLPAAPPGRVPAPSADRDPLRWP